MGKVGCDIWEKWVRWAKLKSKDLNVRYVPPELLAHLGVEELGEGLGEAVGDRLHHDPLVVVVLGAQLLADLLAAKAAAHGERANVVLDARLLWGDEVGHGEVRCVLALLLLAERVEDALLDGARLVVHLDVVADGARGEDAHDALGLERLENKRKKEKSFRTCGGNGVRHMGKRGRVGEFRKRKKNEKRALISDIWGKRSATYGEKGGVSANSKKNEPCS